jgi:hypothetical protein
MAPNSFFVYLFSAKAGRAGRRYFRARATPKVWLEIAGRRRDKKPKMDNGLGIEERAKLAVQRCKKVVEIA